MTRTYYEKRLDRFVERYEPETMDDLADLSDALITHLTYSITSMAGVDANQGEAFVEAVEGLHELLYYSAWLGVPWWADEAAVEGEPDSGLATFTNVATAWAKAMADKIIAQATLGTKAEDEAGRNARKGEMFSTVAAGVTLIAAKLVYGDSLQSITLESKKELLTTCGPAIMDVVNTCLAAWNPVFSDSPFEE
jgi:hypothetical protein